MPFKHRYLVEGVRKNKLGTNWRGVALLQRETPQKPALWCSSVHTGAKGEGLSGKSCSEDASCIPADQHGGPFFPPLGLPVPGTSLLSLIAAHTHDHMVLHGCQDWPSGVWFTKGDFQVARTLGRTNNMVPSAVTCLGMWGLPGWDRENEKCLELITLPTATVFTKVMLKGWKVCIKAAASPLYEVSGSQLPCSPAESCGLVLLFSSHNSAAGLVTKKTHHKPPKINRGKAFLWGPGTCLGGCVLPALCVAHPWSVFVWTSRPEMEDALFTEQLWKACQGTLTLTSGDMEATVQGRWWGSILMGAWQAHPYGDQQHKAWHFSFQS